MPPRPAGADAWIDGEWILRHRRSYWLLGRWVKVPDGASYAPWVIVRSADGTVYYAPSVWLDKHATPVAPPPGLAFATASGGVVVDPRGNPQETGRNVETPPPAPPSAP